MVMVRARGRRPVVALVAFALAAGTAVGVMQAWDTSGAAAAKCSAMSAPVFQRVNPVTSATLLTPWAAEATQAGSKYGFTSDRGTPFRAAPAPSAGLVAVHRLYRAKTKDFVWMRDAAEMATARTKYGYLDQGTNFYASATATSCTTPVHRFRRSDMHGYVVGGTARATLVRDGWVDEGPAFHAAVLVTRSATPTVTKSPTTTPTPTVTATPTVTPTTPGGGTSPLGLDNTGTKLPDTNYDVPAGAVFLATTGNDSNPGTLSAPVRTINKAVALVLPGGTIVVRGGVYRDWMNSGGSFTGTSKSLTLQAYPHESPWFDGTDVKNTGWLSDGKGHWYQAWSTPSFCGGRYYERRYDNQLATNLGPCTHKDMSMDPSNPAAGDPQMAFLDGAYLHQTTSLAEATPGNFYYDWANRRIYLGSNPAGHTVELASRPKALILSGTGSKVLGIGFRRYATNEFTGTITNTAVTISATNALVENSVFTKMAGQALYLQPRGGTVRRTVFAANGFNGMGSNGHAGGDGRRDGLLVESSIFNNNNAEKFGTGCALSCAQAGVKIAHMVGFTMRNNIFENNRGFGMWCDNDCQGGVMVNNIARFNTQAGLYYEISSGGIIASNLIYGNKQHGIRMASATTKIYNNTIVNNGGFIWIYDDPRNKAHPGGVRVGPDTRNVEFVNNVVSGSALALQAQGTSTTATNTVPDQFFRAFDYNSWFRTGGAGQGLIYWVPPADRVTYTSLSGLRAAKGFEAHGIDVSAGSDPFFTDQAAGNYTVRRSSPAYRSGTPLPADVAKAIGVASGTAVDRGALIWPGR